MQTHLGIGTDRLWDIVLTLLAWAVPFILRLAIGHMVEKRLAEVQRRYIVKKTLNYLLSFLFFAATAVIWFGGLAGWSAYLGLVSAGLAIALQDPLMNLAGWIFISVRKPFAVGDRIQIGDHRGDVIDVRLFQFSIVGGWAFQPHSPPSKSRTLAISAPPSVTARIAWQSDSATQNP